MDAPKVPIIPWRRDSLRQNKECGRKEMTIRDDRIGFRGMCIMVLVAAAAAFLISALCASRAAAAPDVLSRFTLL
jgi:hypothetical protein